MNTEVNFIFIGGTYRGYKVLKAIIEKGYKPAYCYALIEDDHEILKFSSEIETLCKNNKVEIRLCKTMSPSDYDKISKKTWDFAIVCGWRTIIQTSILSKFKWGLIAAHDSLLPKYRGFAPLNWAIINGENETGVTLFKIIEGEVDSGPVYNQIKVEISPEDYAIDVYEKITEASIKGYLDVINKIVSGSLISFIQNENEATYTCKRIPEDGKIIWNTTSREIFNLIRGLAHPYPGAYCTFKGQTYHIRKASIGPQNEKKFIGCIPGRVISIRKDGVEVLCRNGTLCINEWENKDTSEILNPNILIKSITSTLQ